MTSDRQKKPLGIALTVVAIAALGFLVFKLLGSSDSKYQSQVEKLIKDARTHLDSCLKKGTPTKCRAKIVSLNALLERAGKPLVPLPEDSDEEVEAEEEANDDGEEEEEEDGDSNEEEESEADELSDAADADSSNLQTAQTPRERKIPPETVAFQLDGKRYLGDAKLLFDRGVLTSLEFELKARPVDDETFISDEEFAAGRVVLAHQSSTGQLTPTIDSVGISGADGPVFLSGNARTFVRVGDEVRRIISLMSATINVDQFGAIIRGTISIDSQPKLKPLKQKSAVLALTDSGEIEYFQSFTFETPYTPNSTIQQ